MGGVGGVPAFANVDDQQLTSAALADTSKLMQNHMKLQQQEKPKKETKLAGENQNYESMSMGKWNRCV